MFLKKARGLLDFLAALLCLWAAVYQTPAGALVRSVAGRILGTHTNARPLLAYYSGGVYEAQEGVRPPALPVEWKSAPSDENAMARGAYSALSLAQVAQRRTAETLAQELGEAKPHTLDTPEGISRVLKKAQADLGSQDAAMLALFVGREPARYAVSRAQAQGRPLELEVLVDQLPSGSFSGGIEAASRALMFGTAYALAWPVSDSVYVSSGFGYRMHPILGQPQFHSGVDLPVTVGTQVHVVADGVVRRASEDGVNGRIVTVDHGHGVMTAYCHNSRLDVIVGQQVKRGQVISASGNTGRSTGPHLHFQLELSRTPVDPLAFRPRT